MTTRTVKKISHFTVLLAVFLVVLSWTTIARAVDVGSFAAKYAVGGGAAYINSNNDLYYSTTDPSQTSSYKKIASNVKYVSIGMAELGYVTNDGKLYLYGPWNSSFVENAPNDQSIFVMDNVKDFCLDSVGGSIAVLKNDLGLYTWGSNLLGNLGNGTQTGFGTQKTYTPTKILDNVKQFSMGSGLGAAVTNDGALYTWGDGDNYCLGNGTTNTPALKPAKIMDGVKQVSVDYWGGAAVKTDGSLVVWGKNESGRLGTGNLSNVTKPTQIATGVNSVYASMYNIAYVTKDKNLYMIGDKEYGAFGNGIEEMGNYASKAELVFTDVVSAVVDNQVMAATSDGNLYYWGAVKPTVVANLLGNSTGGGGSNTPNTPNNPGQTGSVIPIYRLYSPVTGEHLYTPSKAEVSALVAGGWNDEGIGWYAYPSGMGIPVYRLYSPVTHKHLYTTNKQEVNTLTSSGVWTLDFDGEPIFGAAEFGTPVYRLYSPVSQTHLLTTDLNEYNVLGAQGWNQEGTAFYAFSSPNQSSLKDFVLNLVEGKEQPYDLPFPSLINKEFTLRQRGEQGYYNIVIGKVTSNSSGQVIFTTDTPGYYQLADDTDHVYGSFEIDQAAFSSSGPTTISVEFYFGVE